jgi:hypothetical protein
MRMIVEQLVEWRLAGETEVLGENVPQRHLVHHKSHMARPGLEPRAAAVGSQRLTAWAMARPSVELSRHFINSPLVYILIATWTYSSALTFRHSDNRIRSHFAALCQTCHSITTTQKPVANEGGFILFISVTWCGEIKTDSSLLPVV